MKTEVKKLDSTKRQIDIEVSGDIVKNKFEDVFKRLAKEAKVPGFRPGHAPRDILEKHFSANANEQVLKELVPDIYNEAIKNEGLDCLGLPEISEVKLDRAKLSFKAIVEVFPEIAIKDYKGKKINYKRINVTPDEIKRSIDSLKEIRKVEVVDDSFARSLGYPNLSALEGALERQLFIQKENEQRRIIEDGIIEDIIKDLDFKIPQSLVERQLQELVRQAKVDLVLKGIPHEKLDEQEKKMFESLAPEARKQVKVYLALQEIAKRENIELNDNMSHRVIEFLLREAEWVETA